MYRFSDVFAGAFTALAFLIAAPVVLAQDVEPYRGPIIDMHLHAYGVDYPGSIPNPVSGVLSPADAETHLIESLEAMQRHGVVLAAVSGIEAAYGAAWHDRASDRVLRGIVVGDPTDGVGIAHIQELITSGRLDVLGEISAQYEGFSPSDPAFDPFWALAAEHGIPVGIHTGASFPGTPYACCPNFRLKLGDPLLLEDLLVRHPALKVYMMHAGGQYHRNAIDLMEMYPQVHTDLGVLSWLPGWTEDVFHEFLREAKKRGFLDRVVFGTDQMLWPDAIGLAVARLNAAEYLTHAEKRGIFYDNAARFLGLSEDAVALHHGSTAAVESQE
jgi:uncharacterized protein